jgi:Fe-Mn family superoxide dismutase
MTQTKRKFQQLMELPFALEGLEPYMSYNTLYHHYYNHYKIYHENMNSIILEKGEKVEIKPSDSIEDIVLKSYGKDEQLYTNAAQVYNHEFFFQCLNKDNLLLDQVREIVKNHFGSVQNFSTEVQKTASTGLYGYVWLMINSANSPCLIFTHDADCPIATHKNLTPLYCIDMWEHARYLDYQNRKNGNEGYINIVLTQISALDLEENI